MACFVVMAVFACGGGGCSGCAQCGLEPIRGGFPVAEQIPNSAQVRLTESGVGFIEDNAMPIVSLAVPGGLAFPVDEIRQTFAGIDITICRGGGCGARAEIAGLDLVPQDGSNVLRANIRLRLISTRPDGTDGAWPGTCDVTIDTRRSGGSRDFVGITADITLSEITEAARRGYTQIELPPGSIDFTEGQEIENSDIRISGGFLGSCGVLDLDFIKGLILDQLTGQVTSLFDSAIGEQLCTRQGEFGCPTGTVADGTGPEALCLYRAGGECVPALLGMDGRGDLGNAFLGGLSPGTHAPIQILLAAGGEGEAVNSGMSIFMAGGFMSMDRAFSRTPGHNPCVPMTVAPARPTISRVATFRGNSVPGLATPPHLGIGLAEDYLNYAGYGMYDSGMLCLGVGTRLSQQLSTGLFSVLVPTLRALTFPGGAAPISLAVRPQEPPTFEIGSSAGETLLTITLPNAQIDFYVFSQERYIRFMTYETDLVIGVNLSVMDGQIVPEIVGVTPTNSSVLNSEILTENPDSLAMTIETVLTMFAGMLTSGISPIDLPPIDVNGDGVTDISIQVPEGGLRGVDDSGEEFLGIFANLALGTPMSLSLPVETSLELSDLEVLPNSMGQDTFGQNGRNTVWLTFGAEGPEAVAYEYSYRIDGALWSPWTTERRVQIDDAALLLQAHHTIEGRARVVGEPNSVDRTPAMTELLIDVLAPEITLEARRDAQGVRVIAEDIVSDVTNLEMRWRVADGETQWSDWGAILDLDVDPELVQVEVRDEAGNVGRSQAPLIRGIPNPAGAGACDCRAAVGASSPTSGAPLGMFASLLVLGAFVARRARGSKGGSRLARRPFGGDVARAVLSLLAVGALVFLTACDCGGEMGRPDGGPPDAPPVACGGETCMAARPPGDTSGEICCEAEMMCVDYDLATICDPGFICPIDNITVDASCEVACSACEELPPLATGILATDLDLVVEGTDAFLSGYSPGIAPSTEYGDLVFGTLAAGDASAVEWEIVDGVPDDAGRPVGSVDGWRGGIQEAGDNVGRWTSMARGSDGTFFISYYDVTNSALKIAIGRPGSWSSHTVDATGDAGRYTSITLSAAGAPVISYQRIEPAADMSGRIHSAVRVATASSASPSGTADWTTTEVSGLDGACRPEYCAEGQACLVTGACVTPASGCSPACGDESACVAGACQDALADPYVEDLFPGRGLYTNIARAGSGYAVTYYDRSEGNFYGVSSDGTTWGTPFLIDGYSRTGSGDSGLGSSLFVDTMGTWHVTYVDGTDEGLRYAQISGGAVTVRELVDDGTTDGTTPHSDGRHLVGDDSSVIVTGGGEVRVAYQDATSHTLMIARRSGTTWSQRVIDDEDHTGFWVEQAPTATGSRVATWWRRQVMRNTVDGVRVVSGD